MTYRIAKISVQNYRSIKKLTLNIPSGQAPIIICGANNVGKTNYLRAVNLFFNERGFQAHDDIPFEIVEAIRGAGFKSTVAIDFYEDTSKERILIKKIFTTKLGENQIVRSGYKKISRGKKVDLSEIEIKKFLDNFLYILLESSNVHIPELVAEITRSNVLSGLDKLRRRQTKPLDTLKKFTKESEKALEGIERTITKDFQEFAGGLNAFSNGLNITDWNVKFIFPNYEFLREAIGAMVNFILQDSNQKELEAKGSGVQRLLYLTLIKYVSENSKKSVIWGVDEPEVFLQPGLQKKVFEFIKSQSQIYKIFITTHSQHFVDLNELDSVFLFNAEYKKQAYSRKKNKEYIKISTEIDRNQGYAKALKIKDHLGVSSNDSWEVMPYNIIVEGEEDRQYLSTLLGINNFQIPKMLPADGADKIPGYLAFLNLFCEEQNIKPNILIILDFDQKGKQVFDQLKNKKYLFTHRSIYIQRFDKNNQASLEYEVEDFIYPEILLKGVNKILGKKGYDVLDISKTINKKNQAGFIKDNILKFITNEVKNVNPAKVEMNFEAIELKKFLCHTVCELLRKEKNLAKMNLKYPEIRNYLKILSASNLS